LKNTIEFVTSAAREADFPHDGAPELALVGRSNVGKSSLINALARQPVARTSATPGKTRLVNVYRVLGAAGPIYLIDLPGYGYAARRAEHFGELTRAFFGSVRQLAALLVVDSRHSGLGNDLEAWRWLGQTVEQGAIVATKIDKLAHGQRIRALRELESVFDEPVLPVSAATGEGLDDLWKLIDKLAHNRDPRPHSRNRRSLPAAQPHPRK
jgi:GTP-binding protein